MIENVHTPMAVLVLLAVGASLCSCANPDKDAAEGIDYPETMGSASAAQLDAMVRALRSLRSQLPRMVFF